MVNTWTAVVFLLVFLLKSESIPLRNHLQCDFILNSTATTIIIFKNEHKTVYQSFMPFESFFAPNVDNITAYNTPYAMEKQNKSNEVTIEHLNRKCTAIDIPHRHKRNAGYVAAGVGSGALVVGLGLGYVILRQRETQENQRADIDRLQNNLLEFQRTSSTTIYHMKEQIFISDYFTDAHEQSIRAIDSVFSNGFNWDKYEEIQVLPFIEGQAFDIATKAVGCENGSIRISHTVFGGSEPQSLKLYEFYPLGSILNGTYVLPVMEKAYLQIEDKWAILDESLCYNLKKCTMTAVSFPLSNPSNIKDCDVEISNIDDENFLRYVEVDDNIQIITTIKDITLKSNNIQKEIELPPSNKLTIQLQKGDIFIVGNTTFLGKSNVPTKIIYHTNAWNPLDTDIKELIHDIEKTEADAVVERQHANEEEQNVVTFVGGPSFFGILAVVFVLLAVVVGIIIYCVCSVPK